MIPSIKKDFNKIRCKTRCVIVKSKKKYRKKHKIIKITLFS